MHHIRINCGYPVQEEGWSGPHEEVDLKIKDYLSVFNMAKAQAPSAKAAAKKRIVKVDVYGDAHITASFNNIIISITNKNGQVISWSSAGKMGFKGSKKNTPYAAQMAASDAKKQRSVKARLTRLYTLMESPIHLGNISPLTSSVHSPNHPDITLSSSLLTDSPNISSHSQPTWNSLPLAQPASIAITYGRSSAYHERPSATEVLNSWLNL